MRSLVAPSFWTETPNVHCSQPGVESNHVSFAACPRRRAVVDVVADPRPRILLGREEFVSDLLQPNPSVGLRRRGRYRRGNHEHGDDPGAIANVAFLIAGIPLFDHRRRRSYMGAVGTVSSLEAQRLSTSSKYRCGKAPPVRTCVPRAYLGTRPAPISRRQRSISRIHCASVSPMALYSRLRRPTFGFSVWSKAYIARERHGVEWQHPPAISAASRREAPFQAACNAGLVSPDASIRRHYQAIA